MNGVHDMGGMQDFGPVVPEADEPRFHHAWERRAFALTLAMGATGAWNLDQARTARESLPPAQYLASSYYEIWLAGLRRAPDASAASSPRTRSRPGAWRSRRGRCRDASRRRRRRGARPRRIDASDAPGTPARFAPGDAVRTRNVHPPSHTRLPRYCRGKPGTIVAVHGAHVYPDANARGEGETPQWLYTVRFAARELWGPDTTAAPSTSTASSRISSGADSAGRQRRVPTAAIAGAPRDADGPVFAAPWEAQAFALTLSLHERGAFTWKEWAATLAEVIGEVRARGEPDTGERYYEHWLAALERIVARKALLDDGSAASDAGAQWEDAARRTPHGQPIVLHPDD